MTIRVLLAEDHPVVRSGIKTLLSSATDIEVVGEASDGEQAYQMVK
jgi:DNA-binding NarL/FixJ family response regulator